jgi:hypothetical protein
MHDDTPIRLASMWQAGSVSRRRVLNIVQQIFIFRCCGSYAGVLVELPQWKLMPRGNQVFVVSKELVRSCPFPFLGFGDSYQKSTHLLTCRASQHSTVIAAGIFKKIRH